MAMNLEDVKNRIDALIKQADKVIAQVETEGAVNVESFFEFRTASLSFLASAFGEEHIFYKEFYGKTNSNTGYGTIAERGILKAAKQEIDGGWYFTVKGIVSAEIFSSFLERAEHLLEQNYKDASAVMIGSVLEEHLRQLCNKNYIDINVVKNGKTVPKKANLLNEELKKSDIYNALEYKSVVSWLGLRNSAAHGEYEEYSKEQVINMYDGVLGFIMRNPI